MNTNWTDEQLAETLHGILGADLDPNEEDAIFEAIRRICPDYAAALQEAEDETAEYFDTLMLENELKKQGILSASDPQQSNITRFPTP